MGCVVRCGFCLLEDHMIRDFSHELSDTQKHVEQMVQQMMTSLANIRLARLTTEMVQYYQEYIIYYVLLVLCITPGGILFFLFYLL